MNSIKFKTLFSDHAVVATREAGRRIQGKVATQGAGPKTPGKELAAAPEADLKISPFN